MDGKPIGDPVDKVRASAALLLPVMCKSAFDYIGLLKGFFRDRKKPSFSLLSAPDAGPYRGKNMFSA